MADAVADPGGQREQVELIPLARLLLDPSNPRFGLPDGSRTDQTDVLDYIVKTFGVDDILSSLAVNGYFTAEPLVCKAEKGTDRLIVAEGNRRLAACLILVGDERAKNQKSKTATYAEVHRKHGATALASVPVLRFRDDPKALLSYLGVRHIASSQAWDSYAKAVWTAKVIRETDLTTGDVAAMIGDQHRTIERLLEGFHFVQQLMAEGLFDPDNSIRKGRGSNTSYPFSWVYTVIGYSSIRVALGFDRPAATDKPIAADRLETAALLVRAMFGDRSKGISSAVADSRELGDLAAAFANPTKLAMLKEGKNLREIYVATQSIDEHLGSGLLGARDRLAAVTARLTEQEAPRDVATRHLDLSGRVVKLATEVNRRLRESADESGA